MPLEPLPLDHAKHTWDSMCGNGLAREALARLINEGRLPHGVLLHGPAALGKMGFAVAAAKHLLAGGWPPEGEEARRTVAKVGRATHPDIMFARPDVRAGRALQIKIEDVREIERLAPLSPIEAPWRVVIIDDADRMNPSTANALLKLLEEPPAHCKFLLVTHRRAALLPTVLSRLMPVRFAPVPSEELAAWLAEHRGLEDEPAHLAARWSEGRPGAALSLPLEAWEEHLGEVAVVLREFIEGGYVGVYLAASRLLAIGKASAQEGETPLAGALRWTRLWLRDRLVAEAAPGEDDLLTRETANASDGWSAAPLCALGEALERLAPMADRMIDGQLALEECLAAAGAAKGRATSGV